MNWSARGNVLNQYLRNTSIGTTVNTAKIVMSYDMPADVGESWAMLTPTVVKGTNSMLQTLGRHGRRYPHSRRD
jgi:hypothetical protein